MKLISFYGREMSMMGKEFQSLGNLKKYELRVMLLMETLWQSFVPSNLVFEDEKEINSVISKLLLEVLIDLIKNKMSVSS